MAGLSPVPSAVESDNGRDRAQLLLVGAFGLAVLLLVLAGVLNTVTYTESLAARDSVAHDGRGAAAFQEDTRRAVRTIGERINDENASSATKQARVEQNVTAWGENVSRYYARDVTGTDVVVVATTGGAHINQTTDRGFTDRNADGNWTLAKDVSKIQSFEMNVSQSSLHDESCENTSCPELVVDDGSDTWNVTLNNSYVFVEGSNTTGGRCAFNSSTTVDIDLTAGTVNGEPCGPLSIADGLSGPYDLTYRNGTEASGTYRLTVLGGSVDRTDYAADGAPSVYEFVSDASVRITYQTPGMYYETEFRVSWGRFDG